MTRRERGPAATAKAPLQDPPPREVQGQRNPSARPREVLASGFAAPPAGRRTKWAIVIPTCPFCGYLHLHRAAGDHGGRRTSSCGREYRVVLAGSKRGRWAR